MSAYIKKAGEIKRMTETQGAYEQVYDAFYRSVSSIRVDPIAAIDLLRAGDVIITRYGEPVAVMMSYADYVTFVGTLKEAREERDNGTEIQIE